MGSMIATSVSVLPYEPYLIEICGQCFFGTLNTSGSYISFSPSSIRLARSKGSDCRAMRAFLYCYWEHKLIQPLWKSVRQFLRKLRDDLRQDPLGHIVKRCSIPTQRHLLNYVPSSCIQNNQKLDCLNNVYISGRLIHEAGTLK